MPRFLLLENRSEIAADRGIIIDKKNTDHAKASPASDTDCELRRSSKGLSHENTFNGILSSFPRAVILFRVLFHDPAGGDFLSAAAVAP
jgi:hypothetical protein